MSARYPLTVDTLGKLIDVGHHLQPHCLDCGKSLRLENQKVGRDWRFIGPKFSLRCPLCGEQRAPVCSAACVQHSLGGCLLLFLSSGEVIG